MSLADLRYNPFSETYAPQQIDDELHTIPGAANFFIILDENPLYETPSTVEIWTGPGKTGTKYTEVPKATTPGNFQYRIQYSGLRAATVEFNSSQGGEAVYVSYRGIGSTVKAEIIQSFAADKAVLSQNAGSLGFVHTTIIPYGKTPDGFSVYNVGYVKSKKSLHLSTDDLGGGSWDIKVEKYGLIDSEYKSQSNTLSLTSVTGTIINKIKMYESYGLLAFKNKLIKTTDDFDTIQEITNPLSGQINEIWITDIYSYVAGDNGAIYRSANNGISWTACQNIGAFDITSMVATGEFLYACSLSNGIWFSSDAGDTFTQITTSFTPNSILGLNEDKIFIQDNPANHYYIETSGGFSPTFNLIKVLRALGLASKVIFVAGLYIFFSSTRLLITDENFENYWYQTSSDYPATATNFSFGSGYLRFSSYISNFAANLENLEEVND